MLCLATSFRAGSTVIRHSYAVRTLRQTYFHAQTSPRSVTRSFSPRTMASAQVPTYHVLQYSYVPDILEKRDPYRAEHLQGAKDMAAASKIVMAGALTDPVDGAIFVFKNVTKDEIEAFVRKDPYVINGLVPKYQIRPYMVVADSL